MSVKECYKNYKNLVKQEKDAKRKFKSLRYSIYGVNETDEISCLMWNLNKWTMVSELSKCPNFDNSMTHLSGCQGCPMAPIRYKYEICKDEYNRAHDMTMRAKQELIKNIKQSVKRTLSGKGR
ncbi:MAG: hypothetical protein ACLRFJ_00155 [Alphaproteobacteria bacterium]